MNIKTIEVNIDNINYRITTLLARDSYELYLKSISIIAPILKSLKKTTAQDEDGKESISYSFDLDKIDIQGLVTLISNQLEFDFVLRILKSVTINGQEVKKEIWNTSSPLLIIELVAHILKLNVFEELQKKDLGQMITRILGYENSQNELQNKLT